MSRSQVISAINELETLLNEENQPRMVGGGKRYKGMPMAGARIGGANLYGGYIGGAKGDYGEGARDDYSELLKPRIKAWEKANYPQIPQENRVAMKKQAIMDTPDFPEHLKKYAIHLIDNGLKAQATVQARYTPQQIEGFHQKAAMTRRANAAECKRLMKMYGSKTGAILPAEGKGRGGMSYRM